MLLDTLLARPAARPTSGECHPGDLVGAAVCFSINGQQRLTVEGVIVGHVPAGELPSSWGFDKHGWPSSQHRWIVVSGTVLRPRRYLRFADEIEVVSR